MKRESVQYAAALLKSADKDRFYATLVLPPKARGAVQILYAFNSEIAAVRDRAKVPQAGEIRIRWWHDAISGEGHGEVRQNPIARGLLEVIAESSLPRVAFANLLSARRFDIYDDPMPDVPSFEGYAGDTHSVLLQLGAMILNEGKPVDGGDAAGHMGVAQTLVGHLRSFAAYASQNRLFLPLSVFAANGVAEAEIYAGRPTAGISAALRQLLDMAHDHLDKAQSALEQLPRELRAVFAPGALIRMQAKAVDPNAPFQPPRDLPDWRKMAVMTSWALRNS